MRPCSYPGCSRDANISVLDGRLDLCMDHLMHAEFIGLVLSAKHAWARDMLEKIDEEVERKARKAKRWRPRIK